MQTPTDSTLTEMQTAKFADLEDVMPREEHGLVRLDVADGLTHNGLAVCHEQPKNQGRFSRVEQRKLYNTREGTSWLGIYLEWGFVCVSSLVVFSD